MIMENAIKPYITDKNNCHFQALSSLLLLTQCANNTGTETKIINRQHTTAGIKRVSYVIFGDILKIISRKNSKINLTSNEKFASIIISKETAGKIVTTFSSVFFRINIKSIIFLQP